MPIDDEMVELRFDVPRRVFNVLDGYCKAKRVPRNKQAALVMTEWAREMSHVANVVMAINRGNGNEPQSEWADLAD